MCDKVEVKLDQKRVWWERRTTYEEKHLIHIVKCIGVKVMLWDCFPSAGPQGLVKMAKHISVQTVVASARRFRPARRQSFQQGEAKEGAEKYF